MLDIISDIWNIFLNCMWTTKESYNRVLSILLVTSFITMNDLPPRTAIDECVVDSEWTVLQASFERSAPQRWPQLCRCRIWKINKVRWDLFLPRNWEHADWHIRKNHENWFTCLELPGVVWKIMKIDSPAWCFQLSSCKSGLATDIEIIAESICFLHLRIESIRFSYSKKMSSIGTKFRNEPDSV